MSPGALLPLGVRDWFRAPRWTTRYLLWRVTQPRPPRLEAPIFLVGCPRSGTSITVDLLATHPEVANWSEGGRLWDPIHYSDPKADHCWEADRVTARQARRLHGWCEWYRTTHGARRFVNKHPRNSVRIDYLDAIFPDARFIHVIRDGRAVVNSMLTQLRRRPRRAEVPFGRFCKPPNWREWIRDDLVEQTALQWREIVAYVRARRASLGERYLEIRYEDLCSRTRPLVGELFAFAGLSTGAGELDAVPERLENQNHRYRETLAADEIETIERVAGGLLKELAY